MSSRDISQSLRSLAHGQEASRSKDLPDMTCAKTILLILTLCYAVLLCYHVNIVPHQTKLRLASKVPDKFTSGVARGVISPSYSRNSSETSVQSVVSYRNFADIVPNSVFFQSVGNVTQNFAFGDAESQLGKYKGLVTCVPDSFGYTMEESELVFPEKYYPRCSETHPVKYIHFKADFNQHWFELQCKEGVDSKYVTGPSGPFSFPEFIESEPFYNVSTNPGGRVSLHAHEDFLIAKCGNDSQSFDTAIHRPIYNRRRHDETLSQLSIGQKPIIVFLLVIDSFSRRHFFQKLPMTVEFLDYLNKDSEFAVFDSKIHNVVGDGSIHNTMPIFMKGEQTARPSHQYGNMLQDEPIWGDFKRRGFMTLLLFESCDQMFPNELGRQLSADHLVRQFYCALMKFANYSSRKENVKEQRCVGPHMSHVYGFDYINAFSEMYDGAKQFIYAHFTTGHEASGQHAATLDQDLRDFLEGFLERFKAKYEIVIMLQGDHGMRFGEWYNNMKAYQEHKLPAYFFIATKSLLDTVPNSYSVLQHNSLRLHSKKDVRRTLFNLMQYPNFAPGPQEDPAGVFYSVFSEPIPDNRTCTDAGVPAWYCSCLSYQRIDFTWDAELTRAVQVMVDLTIYAMNTIVFTNEKAELGHLCQRIELGKVEEAYGVKANEFSEIMKIVFSVRNSSVGKFTSTFLVSPMPIGNGIRRHQTDRLYLGPTPYLYRGYKTYFTIITISRIDPFEGPCAKVARTLQLKPDFCFCNELDQVAERDPEVAKVIV